jgi:hypothetical protein
MNASALIYAFVSEASKVQKLHPEYRSSYQMMFHDLLASVDGTKFQPF